MILICIHSPRQQWLCEHALVLRYTNIVLLINFHRCLISQFISNEAGRMFGSDGWSISSAAGQHRL
jgi:hypothetical protein